MQKVSKHIQLFHAENGVHFLVRNKLKLLKVSTISGFNKTYQLSAFHHNNNLCN